MHQTTPRRGVGNGKSTPFFVVVSAIAYVMSAKGNYHYFWINCWSSVVASVVLPQFVQSPLSFFSFFVLLLNVFCGVGGGGIAFVIVGRGGGIRGPKERKIGK